MVLHIEYLMMCNYRILCISGRGYYFFVRQKTLYNWVSAALISGAATIRFKEMNIYAKEKN